MKILHAVKKYPQALGGDAVVVANLQKQQQAAGHDVAIITSNCQEIVSGTSIYKFGLKDTPARLDEITIKRIISLLTLFIQAFFILRKERPEVVHTHSIDMAFFLSFAARLYRIPVIHTFHMVVFYDNSQPALRQKSELWLARRAGLRCITAPNAYDVKMLQSAGLQQTVLLPDGVDLLFWQKAQQRKKGRQFMFLSIGRLETQKGFEYLIKATSLLVPVVPGTFQVIIVGEGSQREALRKLIRTLHLEDVVLLMGRRSPEEIRILLSQAHAAVFPSLYETTPVTLLEAWAARVPTIITPVGILRDVPQDFDGAIVVPLKDELSLMHAMNNCMVDKSSLLKVATRGYEEAKKYAWPLTAQTVDSIYRNVL